MCEYLFLIHYKEFQAPQNCSSHSHVNRKSALFWDQKQVFLPFKINNVYITIKCMTEKTKLQINIIENNIYI